MLGKLLSSVILLVVSLLCGLLPIWLSTFAKSNGFKAVVATVNAVSCGVFLSLLVDQLIPEAQYLADEYRDKFHPEVQIPTLSAGFLIGVIVMILCHLGPGRQGHSHEAAFSMEMSERSQDTQQDPESQEEPTEDRMLTEPTPDAPVQQTTTAAPTGFFLFVALLSLHSFFEGLPIGMTNCDVWMIFWPMCLHKALESLTIGCLGSTATTGTAFWPICIYAGMSPLGVIFGSFFTALEPNVGTDFCILVLMGVSIGAVSFITFIELLAPQITGDRSDVINRILFIVLGWFFTAMSISFVSGSGQGHSHGQEEC